MQRGDTYSIEDARSWQAALATLAILSVSFGAPLLVVVGMRPMQAAMFTDRTVLATASALVWVGNALGGVPMGWLAERIGIRATAALGLLSIAAGLTLSSLGTVATLYAGHGLFIGFMGNGALYAPLTVYVSRWFDRRRGTALALVASGQYIAGILWPTILASGIGRFGWKAMMLSYAIMVVAVLPLTLALRPSPNPERGPIGVAAGEVQGVRALSLRPNTVMSMLCVAGFVSCVPMALPASHLVAFCGDIGINPGKAAAMLSVMLTCAFISRQFWGIFADRFGGLRTILTGSACQAVTLAGFLLTHSEDLLFIVAGAYGLGFSGIIPAYSITIRDLFPSVEASWRIPTVLLMLMSGMAFGSWLGGWLFDIFFSYRVAFGMAALLSGLNVGLVLLLTVRLDRGGPVSSAAVS